MLNLLPLDIVLQILTNFSKINDIINIIIVNKYFYKNIDDDFFKLWGIKKYSYEFWINAEKRSKSISKPLNSMKLEILRLEKFIESIKLRNIIWSNKDFYDFWHMLEQDKITYTKFKYKKDYLNHL